MAIKEYKKGVAVRLSENFKSTEFDCNGKGCCSKTLIDPKLVEHLQQIRDHFGAPVKICSSYRCEIHNPKVGGVKSSKHLKGMAADIKVEGVEPAEVAKYAESIGVLGIGLYDTDKDGHFVHIDTRDKKGFWYGHAQEYRSTFGGAVSKVDYTVKEFQKAAIADGYKFPKYGADGIWGEECEAVAKKAICKKPLIKGRYKNKNLTAFYQRLLGFTGKDIDGKFWTATEKAVKARQKALGFTGKEVDGEIDANTHKKFLGV